MAATQNAEPIPLPYPRFQRGKKSVARAVATIPRAIARNDRPCASATHPAKKSGFAHQNSVNNAYGIMNRHTIP
jgi:hypothetical protein